MRTRHRSVQKRNAGRRGRDIGIAASSLALLLLVGCARDEIREYTTAKSEFAEKPAPPGNMGGGTDSGPEEPHWTLPQGWSEHPGTGIRFATLHVDNGDPPLELRVTPLALSARDPLANINRWASQIGLPRYEADQLDSVLREIESHGRTLQLVTLTGPDGEDGSPAQQILAAIVPGNESAWFFMVLGDHDRVRQLEGHFEEFMRTVHFTQPPQQMAEAPAPPKGYSGAPTADAGSGSSGGAGGMTWTLPAHWVASSESGNMRLATIHVAEGNEQAEVTVTRFPGDVGGLLPNINRWRRQLGMPPVASLTDQPLQSLRVAQAPASLLDLVADGADPNSQRMFVVILPHEGLTWFLKMTGSASFLAAQRPAFDAFVSSVAFEGGTPGE